MKRLAYSVDETAEMLGISNRTLWQHIKHDKFPHFRVGDRVLISVSALERFIENGGTESFKNKSDTEGEG